LLALSKIGGDAQSCAYLWPQLAYGEAQVLDKIMYEEEVRREVFAFEQQFHYAVRLSPAWVTILAVADLTHGSGSYRDVLS
jgi:hypothetical protein